MRLALLLFLGCLWHTAPLAAEPLRVRDLGITVGVLPTGQHNAITDVDDVSVGQVTLIKGNSVRTGVTAVIPHGGNLYQDKVPAAAVIGNGFGKMMGYSQIHELGEIETPIVLTNTLSVATAANAIITWTLAANPSARSVNAVVGETNDGRLNDIRGRHITEQQVLTAIQQARSGRVAEGSVGAGTGTVAFGWKGGIGTSSRVLPTALGGFTVGVLVQSNFGGVLQIDGLSVGETLGQFYLDKYVDSDRADGSIMIIVATDAPLSDRNLRRLANRALAGLARTGASMTNGSGDYVIAFSTAPEVRRTPQRRNNLSQITELPNNRMSPLFQASIEATEEAIYNSLLMAQGITSEDPATGKSVRVDALPVDAVKTLIERRKASY